MPLPRSPKRNKLRDIRNSAHLLEANVVGVQLEALTAEVEAVLADHTVVVTTNTARNDTG
jgi:hypothetical protein